MSPVGYVKDHMAEARTWARGRGLTEQQAKSVFVAPLFASTDDPQGGCAWYLIHGAERSTPPSQRLRVSQGTMGGFGVGDFSAYLYQVAEIRGRLLRACRDRGYLAPDREGTIADSIFAGLSAVEASVVWRVVRTLRSRHGIFSHAVIHDAILVSTDISAVEVHHALADAAALSGVPSLRFKEVDLVEARGQAQRAVDQDGFSAQGPWSQNLLEAQLRRVARPLQPHTLGRPRKPKRPPWRNA